MRLRPLVPGLKRRPPLRTIQVLPALVTLGNLLAGVLALSYLQDAAATSDLAESEKLWMKAAWLVFFGMFCDALDGRIARLTRSTSTFGAQLDSLADIVTFGVVPAVMAKSLLTATFPMLSSRFLLALVVVYVVGAALRLARYNVESTRLSAEGHTPVTMVFRGLPSPAAAGVVAAFVLLRHEYQLLSLDWAVLLCTPLLGLLMVSRLPYPHLLNRYLEGRRPLYVMVLLALTVFLFIAHFLETITAAFLLYAASGPALYGVARLSGRPRWVLEEEEDEADLVDDEDEDEAEPGPEPPIVGLGG
jgi:CDP-diacylglycerol--serine O-phosphatidyltransferase